MNTKYIVMGVGVVTITGVGLVLLSDRAIAPTQENLAGITHWEEYESKQFGFVIQIPPGYGDFENQGELALTNNIVFTKGPLPTDESFYKLGIQELGAVSGIEEWVEAKYAWTDRQGVERINGQVDGNSYIVFRLPEEGQESIMSPYGFIEHGDYIVSLAAVRANKQTATDFFVIIESFQIL